jgi:TetR/AcrR family transcriptional regulator
MAPSRRVGTETSRTRALLLDVTERLLVEESFAAVTSRRVAAEAGVNAALVHYYFPTLDDLFVAVYKRRTEHLVQRLSEDLQTDQPLWAMWEYNSDRTGTALASEFLALANHRRAIRAEIAEVAERLHGMQLDALSGVLERYGIDTEVVTPAAVVMLMVAIPRAMVIEEALGMTSGHQETRALVEHFLERLEGPRRRPARGRPENTSTTSYPRRGQRTRRP